MPKLDSNIYGIDTNTFAQKVSSEALSQTSGDADIWGAVKDDSALARGTSKGTVPSTNPVVIISDTGGKAKASTGN